MEIFTLDEKLERDTLIEQYTSFIWTERYQAAGDFELTLPAKYNRVTVLQPGTLLGISGSYRVMRIEIVTSKTQDEEDYVIVKGRSVEAILMDRMAHWRHGPSQDPPEWKVSGTEVWHIPVNFFNWICRDLLISEKDIIPRATYNEPADFPDDKVYRARGPVTLRFLPQPLYDVIKTICETYDLGFRLTRHEHNNEHFLYFSCYSGMDRTTQQDSYPALVVSKEMGHLGNLTETTTHANAKNVAYVVSKKGFVELYAPGHNANETGFNRNIVSVNVPEIDDSYSIEEADFLMRQKGVEALALGRTTYAFDGEITSAFPYEYEKDYRLGDKLEFWGATNVSYIMTVIEYIFVSDETGERSYPTFKFNTAITPGSWLDEKYEEEWPTMPFPEQWYTQE